MPCFAFHFNAMIVFFSSSPSYSMDFRFLAWLSFWHDGVIELNSKMFITSSITPKILLKPFQVRIPRVHQFRIVLGVINNRIIDIVQSIIKCNGMSFAIWLSLAELNTVVSYQKGGLPEWEIERSLICMLEMT